jgi:hypothetical protein
MIFSSACFKGQEIQLAGVVVVPTEEEKVQEIASANEAMSQGPHYESLASLSGQIPNSETSQHVSWLRPKDEQEVVRKLTSTFTTF